MILDDSKWKEVGFIYNKNKTVMATINRRVSDGGLWCFVHSACDTQMIPMRKFIRMVGNEDMREVHRRLTGECIVL